MSLVFFAPLGFILSVSAAIAAVISGFGTQWGWWHFTAGFAILKWAAYAGLASAGVSGVGAFFAARSLHLQKLMLSVAGIMVGIIIAGIPWSWQQKIQELPRIHDITTDRGNPPGFRAILSIRKRAPNRAVYGGRKIAALQRAAYPDIKPLFLTAAPAPAFERALAAARRMGWMIVDANSSEGRIEATATTFWFGFKDDVVVRVKRIRGGSRVDVRSVSRQGLSDAGTNAARIRTYLEEVRGDY